MQPSPTPSFAGDVYAGVAHKPIDIALVGDSVWVADHEGDAVVRIDPKTGAVRSTVSIGAGSGPGWFATSGTDLFVTDQNGMGVTRIDTTSATVKGVAAPDAAPCCSPVIGAGSLWVLNGDAGNLLRIDPASLKVQATVPVGTHPDGLTFDGTLVWGQSGDDLPSIWVVDPATNEVTQTGLKGYVAVADSGSLWIGTGEGLGRVDLKTKTVVSTVAVDGLSGIAVGPGGVYATRGSTLIDHSSVLVIDPATLATRAEVKLPGLSPTAIRYLGGDLWISVFEGGTVLRLRAP